MRLAPVRVFYLCPSVSICGFFDFAVDQFARQAKIRAVWITADFCRTADGRAGYHWNQSSGSLGGMEDESCAKKNDPRGALQGAVSLVADECQARAFSRRTPRRTPAATVRSRRS